MRLKKGDKVKAIKGKYKGKIGIIQNVAEDGTCAVEFEENIKAHNCFNHCKDGHGWWYLPRKLRKIDITLKEIMEVE